MKERSQFVMFPGSKFSGLVELFGVAIYTKKEMSKNIHQELYIVDTVELSRPREVACQDARRLK